MQLWVDAMRAERYGDAWALADASLAARDPARRDDPSLPYHLRWVWDGTALDGRDVLVRCYHGLGDTLQFARFLPLLARRARRVTLEVQPHLIPLLGDLPGVAATHPFDPAHPLPPADADVEITELPHALRAAPAEAPPPYLAATPAPLPRGTVGLCYRAGDWDDARSIPPALLAPLCDTAPTVTLVAEPSDLPVRNRQGCPFDMVETAALVAGCDLVVTVDTMIAHLAGALGKRTWVLLKRDPDWRWCTDRSDTPWYPATRCFAQPTPGDWPGVLALVEEQLRRWATRPAQGKNRP